MWVTTPSSGHLLFSCSSMRLIPCVGIFPRKICAVDLSLTRLHVSIIRLSDLCVFWRERIWQYSELQGGFEYSFWERASKNYETMALICLHKTWKSICIFATSLMYFKMESWPPLVNVPRSHSIGQNGEDFCGECGLFSIVRLNIPNTKFWETTIWPVIHHPLFHFCEPFL